MKKVFIYSLSLLLGTTTAYAQTCTPTPDCNALGYTKTVDDCSGEVLKCPFDISKVSCLELPGTCGVASILYSDKSCSKTVESGKTPIGVVFDKNRRLAVALDQASSRMPWEGGGKTSEDVTSLSNCTSSSTVLACNTNGKDNTSKIVSQYGSSSDYAAGYCASYNTSDTEVGDWFLPSMADLQSIYNAKTYVNASLTLLGKPKLTDDYYWSSTEDSNHGSWIFSMTGGGIYTYHKSRNNLVRAVVAY